ncbi:MAG: hypothetical protein U1E14_18080 [Geminicoccaceae bacterium]
MVAVLVAAIWWLAGIGLILLAVHVVGRFGGIVRPFLGALFFPLMVLAVAGFMLFGTVQGRDLAVSLLGAPWTTLAMLALALFYWATGSWHTARLGLNRRFGTDPAKWNPRHRPWLRWLPRLIGAAAHLFAAISIWLAVPYVAPAGTKTPFLLLGALPVVMIVGGCAVMWREDRYYLRAKAELDAIRDRRTAWVSPSPAELEAEAEVARRLGRARLRMWILIAVAAVLTVAMMSVEPWIVRRAGMNADSIGLGRAAGWVLLSAACFLLLVTSRKAIGEWLLGRLPTAPAGRIRRMFEEADDRSATSSMLLAVALAGVAVLIAAWAWLSPLTLGSAGAMVIAFLAFGAYIAVIDLVRLLAGSRRRIAALVATLLVVAVLTPWTVKFHRVRLCSDGESGCSGAQAFAGPDDPRPTVEQAADAWFAKLRDTNGSGPVPMLIVATAGGGIRAAYWTATVLESLADSLGKQWLREHLFAISGVSGGSLGGLAAVAWLEGRLDPAPTEAMLTEDFLAPTLATFAFVDIPSAVLPEHHFGDRGWSLERSWEAASGDVLAAPFLSFGRARDDLGKDWWPLLLLNATHQSTGKRVITASVQVDDGVFRDSFDLHTLLQADVPASTAAHNSARFTYVSPAGSLYDRDDSLKGYILDGGYFENFGALTALQLARAAEDRLGRDKVRPIVLMISSDPGLVERDRVRQDTACDRPDKVVQLAYDEASDGDAWWVSYLTQLVAPAAGMLASREAHGIVATQELARWTCGAAPLPAGSAVAGTPAPVGMVAVADDASAVAGGVPNNRRVVHLAMCQSPTFPEPPLGWVLSTSMRRHFDAMLKACGNDGELLALRRELGAPPT